MKAIYTTFLIFILATIVAFTGESASYTEKKQIPDHQGQTVGPPNGTYHKVTSSKEISKPASAPCGFNDLSFPNIGVFRREFREYSEYKDGKLIKTWTATVDVFVRCS